MPSMVLGCPKMNVQIYLSPRIYSTIAISAPTGTINVNGLMAENLKILTFVGSSFVNNSDITTLVMDTATGNLKVSDTVCQSSANLAISTFGDISIFNLISVGSFTGNTVKGSLSLNGVAMASDTSTMTLTTQWGDANIINFNKGSLYLTANAGDANVKVPISYNGTFTLQARESANINGLNVTFTTNSVNNKIGRINSGGSSNLFAKTLTGTINLSSV